MSPKYFPTSASGSKPRLMHSRPTGTPPDRSVINELIAAWQNCAELPAQGRALAESFALTPLPDVGSLASLSEIKVLLGKIALTEEERKTTEQVLQRPVDKPLPRLLLNADLSRIPSLVMNKYGEVEGVSKPSFADSILWLVASGAARVL
jgi:hypothetical protein